MVLQNQVLLFFLAAIGLQVRKLGYTPEVKWLVHPENHHFQVKTPENTLGVYLLKTIERSFLSSHPGENK